MDFRGLLSFTPFGRPRFLSGGAIAFGSSISLHGITKKTLKRKVKVQLEKTYLRRFSHLTLQVLEKDEW